MLRHAGRLADQYVNISGHHIQQPERNGALTEVAWSHFLRPYSPALARLDNLRLVRIRRAIDVAAIENGIFHFMLASSQLRAQHRRKSSVSPRDSAPLCEGSRHPRNAFVAHG
jgi:hypothetical protein